MLIIRTEQMEVFDAASLRQFEDREILRLRAKFPLKTQDLSDAEIRDVIRIGIQSSEVYEITDEVDVGRYMDFMFQYGNDFDTNPDTSWANEILIDESLTGTEKMNALEQYELFKLILPKL